MIVKIAPSVAEKMMMASQKRSNRMFQTKQYSNGQLAVFLRDNDGEPLAELSIMQDSVELAPDEFIFKDYSENSGLVQDLLDSKMVVPTDRFVLVGYHLCPVCKFYCEV